MDLSGFIARRYLFAHKSHGVINIISMISTAGIAVGCAALIIILSIYNGFDEVIRTLNDSHTPDLVITPAEGKTFADDGQLTAALGKAEGVRAVCGVLEETVYLKYGDRNAVATAKGVSPEYQDVTGLADYIDEGVFRLRFGTLDEAVVGRTLALQLGLKPAFLTPLEIYFPSRSREVSLLDPSASLHYLKTYPSGTVSLEQNFDSRYIFIPLEALSRLVEKEGQVSSVEIYADSTFIDRHGVVTGEFRSAIASIAGEGFEVRDRRQQNDTLYKLLIYEKMAIYAILLFVIIIISFNVFCSLSMLVIEKRADIEALRAMGATEGFTKRIFVKEGWLISLLGVAVGVSVGLAVCLVQQKFGIVKMPGSFVVDAYPVDIRLADVLITAGSVAIIGYLTALLVRKD